MMEGQREASKVTREDIRAGLGRLGLEAGACVLAHSSLRSFGYVEDGADAVIDAMLDVVGPSGTVLVPTLSFRQFHPAQPRFDVCTTPSETGRITEVFRQRQDARRSCHPVSSAAAIGAAATYLTAAHLDTPCGPTSPYGRLVELDGWCLFLGAGFQSNSVFHVAEEMATPPYLGFHPLRDVHIVDQTGRAFIHTFRRYDCADRGVRRLLAKLEPVYRDQELLRETTIGSCRAVLIRARDNVRATVAVLRQRPAYVLTA